MKESWARRSAPDKRTADVQCEKKAPGSSNPEGTGLTDRGIAPSPSQPLSEEERDRLINENLKLVRSVSRRIQNQYSIPMRCFDDMLADGAVGLAEAARRYQPREGGSFVPYAWAWIRGRILRGLKHSGLLLESLRKSEVEPGHQIEDRMVDELAVSQLLSKTDQLTEKEAAVVEARFRHHKTLRQIARETGVNKRTVGATMQRAKSKLQLILRGRKVKNATERRKQRREMVINTVRDAIPCRMSEVDLAVATEISRTHFQKIAQCKSVPSLQVALLLAKALDKRVEELFQLRDGTSPGAATNR